MKKYLIKTIYFFGLIAILFDATLIFRRLMMTTLGRAEMESEALNNAGGEAMLGQLVERLLKEDSVKALQ